MVALRENVRKAWSNIDVLLTQRHDELPKLVETCKRYMAYEQATLERVMQARAAVFKAQGRGDVAALGAAEDQLRQGLGRLFALAENYPDLKADQSFHHLQSRITGTRGGDCGSPRALQRSRQPEQHPAADFPRPDRRARSFEFKPAQLLEFAEEQKRDVDMGKLFELSEEISGSGC